MADHTAASRKLGRSSRSAPHSANGRATPAILVYGPAAKAVYVVIPIPQANSLARLRGVVAVVARSQRIARDALGTLVNLSPRHTGYYTGAAILLGLLSPAPTGAVDITPTGAALLRTEPGTAREGQFWQTVISRSPIGTELAPDLFAEDGPRRDDLAGRIADYAGLSRATAERRADCLLSWRAQVFAQLGSRPEVTPT